MEQVSLTRMLGMCWAGVVYLELMNKQRGPRPFSSVRPDRRHPVSAFTCGARPGKSPLWPGLADLPGVNSGSSTG